ncbi:MAG: NAD(P)-binding protein [Pseudomonadota bacterium]
MAEIAIVGAGMAGLAAAEALTGAGHAVRIYEKSGGLGGRLATRRSAAGGFDHGAPGFTAGDPAFAALLASAAEGEQAAPWHDGAASLLTRTRGPAHTGLPGASGTVRAFLTSDAGLSEDRIARRSEVTALSSTPQGGWRLSLGQDDAAADILLLAIPAPQAARLLGTAGIAEPAFNMVAMAPRLTAMVAFMSPVATPDSLAPPIEKALRENDKPGRASGDDRWVLHADADWSAAHVDEDKDAIAERLIAAFAEGAGPLPPETYRAGHRWRYGLTTRPLGQPCLWHAERRLGLCGDWCLGDTVEHAFRSGRSLAARVSDTLG